MSDRGRQAKIFGPKLECIGCGAVAQIGEEKRTANVMSVSPLLYRRGKGKGRVRCGRRVPICEVCLTNLVAGTVDSRAVNFMHGLCQSLKGVYNASVEAEAR